MKNLTYQGEISINDVPTFFGDIRMGECFVSMDPSDALKRLKGRILIKMSANRVQELADSNVRFTLERDKHLGKCCKVHMPWEVPAKVLEELTFLVND